MTTPVILFKAKSPAPLKGWEDDRMARWKDWMALGDQLSEELNGATLIQIQRADTLRLAGYRPLASDETPIKGFRLDADGGYMVPSLRSNAGKEWAQRFEDAVFVIPDRPGLPRIVIGSGRMGRFSIERLGSQYFASLGFDPSEHGETDANTGLAQVDPTLWEPAKLSEFHLAKESHEEAAGKES